MLKVIYRAAAVATLASLPISASALGITVTETTTVLATAQTSFKNQLNMLGYFTIEDFEEFAVGQEAFAGKSIDTDVGALTFSGTSGNGAVAKLEKSVGRIENVAAFGRRNTSEDSFGGDGIASGPHTKYLESNDVQTLTWAVSDKLKGRQFDRLMFSITDAADQGATLQISAGTDKSVQYSLAGGANGQIRNFVVTFDSLQNTASVIFANTRSNVNRDGVGFDNLVVGAVPLPAAVWLLLGVSGALVAGKRRSARNGA